MSKQMQGRLQKNYEKNNDFLLKNRQKIKKKLVPAAFPAKIDKQTATGASFFEKVTFFVDFGLPRGTQKSSRDVPGAIRFFLRGSFLSESAPEVLPGVILSSPGSPRDPSGGPRGLILGGFFGIVLRLLRSSFSNESNPETKRKTRQSSNTPSL